MAHYFRRKKVKKTVLNKGRKNTYFWVQHDGCCLKFGGKIKFNNHSERNIQ